MSENKKKGFIARVLDSPTVRRIAPGGWIIWRKTTDAYLGTGYKSGEKPPKSGDLLVQSPYSDWYNLVWGLAPSQDMPKWRYMYRSRPEIRRGIDTKVILSVGRAFEVVCTENEEIEKFANDLLYRLNIRDILQSAYSDMLVYGQAYFEKVRVKKEDQLEHEKVEQKVEAKAWLTNNWKTKNLDDDKLETIKAWVADIQKATEWIAQKNDTVDVDRSKVQNGDGELVELKVLDPLWMRINRDAFGNVLGFVQWGLTPIPQSILAEKIVFLRWMPKSWAHENAYGTSILMPVQRHVSLLIQAEEDMKVFWHRYAKPMIVAYAGQPDKPWPTPKKNALAASLAGMQPNMDLVVEGDAKIDFVKGGMGETAPVFDKWAAYLREKIYEAIGVPSSLMNMQASTSRASDDVLLQAFVADEQMAQQILGEQFLKQVIEPEVRRKFGDKIPPISIVWPPVLEEDRNKKADREIKLTGSPIITVNEARVELGFKPLGPEYDKIAEQAKPGFGQLSKGPEDSESTRTGAREEEAQKQDKA